MVKNVVNLIIFIDYLVWEGGMIKYLKINKNYQIRFKIK